MKQIRLCLMTVLLMMQYSGNSQQNVNNTPDDHWLKKASAFIVNLEYGFRNETGVQGQFHAVNPANKLLFTHITHQGYRVGKPGENKPAGIAVFEIRNVGGNPATSPAEAFRIAGNESRIIFRSSAYDVEYIHGEEGLRQNFVVHRKAVSHPLSVEIGIQTTHELTLLPDNQLIFREKGKVTLVYNGLKAWDADGKILEAAMQLDHKSHTLHIEVNDKEARYPVTIDPLNSIPEWTTSADGILPALLNNLQLQVQTLYGHTVAGLGDINGDGFDDVAVSAPGMADVITGNGTLTGVGAVFIYLGSAAGLPVTPSKVLQPTTAVEGALFGYSIDAGDMTGDGRNDIVIGSPLDSYQTTARALIGTVNVNVRAGKVYVYRSEDLFSAPNPSPFLEVRLQGPAYFCNVLTGLFQSNVDVHALFGYSVAVSNDLNGDNKADLLIGSPAYLGTEILSVQSGAAFVYYSDNLSTTSPDELQTPDPTLLGLPLLPLSNTTGLLFGFSIDGAGDFNNDGKPDVVVGAPAGVDLSSLGGIFSGQFLGGSAYVFYGNGAGVSGNIGIRLQADASGLLSNTANLFGYDVKGARNAAGQKTGHIIVGAPNGALLSNVLNGLRLKAGQLHIFKKKSAGATGSSVSDQVISSPRSSSLLSILSGQTIRVSALFGSSIDNMLDVNCDNIGDIIVGEPLSTAVPMIGADVIGGAAYIYLGKIDGTYQAVPFWNLGVTVSPLLGVNATSLIGYSVAGAGYTKGRSQGVRSLAGGPSNTLDYGAGLLNLGNTLAVTFDFVFDNNGLGKAYAFPFNNCNIPLPAKLIEFNAARSGNQSLLNWVSVNEENMTSYELQRSPDGLHFETIQVSAARNRPENNYSYTDTRPLPGINYYRLKMNDNDNSFSYSGIRKVDYTGISAVAVSVAPNPAYGYINVQLSGMESGTYKLELINASGQSVYNRVIYITGPMQQERILPSSLQSGMYILKVTNSQHQLAGISRILYITQ